MPVLHSAAVPAAVRVFISYAHGDSAHEEQVRDFWTFLREHGIDAHLDVPAAERPQDWPDWMMRQFRTAQFVLMIASPAYRRRAEGDAPAAEGRGVQFEARHIREEVYADREEALKRFLPVVLPGCSVADIPHWMGPTTATHYAVSEYTVEGAEKLLRLLTGQPYETEPPLGSTPVLLTRGGSAAPGTTGVVLREMLLRRLADRGRARNEAMVQADVRQLLLAGGLGLHEDDLGVELGTQAENRRRIDIAAASTVIEVRKHLGTPGVLEPAERQLAAYAAARAQQTGHRYVAVLTDGAEWRLYRVAGAEFQPVAARIVDPSAPDAAELLRWLESVLATGTRLEPTPREIVQKLGAGSPAHAVDVAELAAIYARYGDLPTVQVKRGLWAKLLTTALGTNFTDADSLFVDHTLLVTMAKVIGHAVIGIPHDDQEFSAATMMSGELFTDADIAGVVEADFFDWIVHVPGGDQFVENLERRLSRFAWEQVEHDVMKVLYESIISPQIRHLLGEYYTPDWLAEKIVAECVTDPLAERVLDASCGSGTFLFHAVRWYLDAAEAAGVSPPEAIRGVVAHVMGVDVHPVAVTLARVTYLLAIGMSRLQADDRPAFAVPVYLGDSLRWGQESTLLSYQGISIRTDDQYEIFLDQSDFTDEREFTERLKFPDRVVADSGRFDRLVATLADLAAAREPGTAVPSLRMTFTLFEIDADDRPVLERTFRVLCELHDEGRDHIWGYVVRNVARPAWLSRPDNRIDVLVGNPPWLAYRYMTRTQQTSFRAMSAARNLWAGTTVATHQDLSALFVARCIEQYLTPGGRFGYVMPFATLSRRQYAGFRTGSYPVQFQHVKVEFDRPWDLHLVKPAFFPVPAGVVFGRRVDDDEPATALDQVPEVWNGRFRTATASWAEAEPSIGRTIGEPAPAPAQRSSRYATRFAQGATVVPRFLFLVEPAAARRLGSGAGRTAVRSRRSANEKKPWKDLPTVQGTVERQFLRPLYVGESILPFRCLQPGQAVIPWDGHRLLHGGDEHLDLYPGLARWWRTAEEVWTRNRSSERLSLLDQLDYRRKLAQQFPVPDHRVVYGASGMYLAAAVVSDRTAVIEHELYWGSATSLDEARFLTAILNSTTLTMAVRPLQARGEHNPRHFDKYVFQLPIPLYDPADTAHTLLVELAERSEEVAAGVDLPAVRFEARRRRVREALAEDGVAAEIDAIVKTLLA